MAGRTSLVLPAIGGLASLTVGIVGLAVITVSPAGIHLLVLAAASLAMEVLYAPGMLLHAVGGGVALTMAGVCLHEPGTGAHPGLVVPVAVGVAAATWRAGRRSWRAVRDDPFDDSEHLLGRIATVLDTGLNTDGRRDHCHGHAVIVGAVWSVSATGRPLEPGQRVRVVAVRGDTLVVVPSRTAPL